MRFTNPAKPRSARDVIACMPSFVAVDAEGLYLASRFVLIETGTPGYSPLYRCDRLGLADKFALGAGADRLPTEAEREAALIGSMYGWDVPGADPLNYSLSE